MEKSAAPSPIHPSGKRFAAFFMDNAILAMLSMFLFAGVGAPIFQYYSLAGRVSSAYDDVAQVAADTHLLSGNDALYPTDDGATQMGRDWLGLVSKEAYANKDNVLYYFTTSYQGKSLADYNALFLGGSYAGLFVSVPDAPVEFSSGNKTLIQGFYSGKDTSKEAVAAYNSGMGAFKEAYQKDWVYLAKEDGRYIGAYHDYASLRTSIDYGAGQAALLSYCLAALLYYVGLPFLLKKGRTLGKKVLHLEVISSVGELTWQQVVSRGIIETLEFSYLTVFSPFFFLQTAAIFLPIFGSGNFAFTMITLFLASLALCLVSGVMALITREKKTLQDFATFTEVVATEALDREQKKKEEERKETADGTDPS